MNDEWQQHMTEEVYQLLLMIRSMGINMKYNPNTFRFVIVDDDDNVLTC